MKKTKHTEMQFVFNTCRKKAGMNILFKGLAHKLSSYISLFFNLSNPKNRLNLQKTKENENKFANSYEMFSAVVGKFKGGLEVFSADGQGWRPSVKKFQLSVEASATGARMQQSSVERFWFSVQSLQVNVGWFDAVYLWLLDSVQKMSTGYGEFSCSVRRIEYSVLMLWRNVRWLMSSDRMFYLSVGVFSRSVNMLKGSVRVQNGIEIGRSLIISALGIKSACLIFGICLRRQFIKQPRGEPMRR